MCAQSEARTERFRTARARALKRETADAKRWLKLGQPKLSRFCLAMARAVREAASGEAYLRLKRKAPRLSRIEELLYINGPKLK